MTLATLDTCQRKVAYHSLARAGGVAAHSLKKRGVVLWAYQCPACGLFHLTRQDQTTRVRGATGSGGWGKPPS